MKKHLKLNPIELRPGNFFDSFNKAVEVWGYEEGHGISIYGQFGTRSGHITTISLATIRAYLKRLDKK